MVRFHCCYDFWHTRYVLLLNKLLFRPRNVILAFLSSHFAICNNQGRHFDERKVKKPFLSFEYKLQYICTLVLGLEEVFEEVVEDGSLALAEVLALVGLTLTAAG